MPPAHELTAPSPRVPALAVPRVAVRYRVALAVLALTALTFLIPSAPTYDPWAWIIWGREILHLDLSTVDGPSWKPLPVLLTTPFALFGGLAPDLWLFVARAGAHRRRRHGLPASRGASAGCRPAPPPRRAYAVAPWMLRNAALGNSEGLLVALGLAAVDRHLAGRTPPGLPARDRRRAPAPRGLAVPRPLRPVAALARARRAPARRGGLRRAARAVAAARAVGLGRPAARRAPRAEPARQQRGLRRRPDRARSCASSRTMLTPAAVGRARRARRVLAAAPAAPAAASAAPPSGWRWPRAVWVGEVAVMTNDGFSGNTRYLIMPAALACVLAGTGIGWLIRALPARWFGGGVAVAALVRRWPPSPSPRRASRRLDAVRVGASTTRRASPTASPGAIAQRRRADRLQGLRHALHRAPSRCPPWPGSWACTLTTVRVGQRSGRRARRGARRRRCGRRRQPAAARGPEPREPRRRGRRADARHLAAAGASWAAATHERRRRRPSRARGRASRALGTARLARQPAQVAAGPRLPRRALARAAHAGDPRALLDRRGPLGRHLLAPARRHPRRPAPGRLAAAVLPAPQAVDERLRRRRGATRTRSRSPSRSLTVPGGVARRARAVRRARRAGSRRCWRRSTRS